MRKILKRSVEVLAKCLFIVRTNVFPSREWSANESGKIAVYLNATMGFGDYLMLSPLLAALERSNREFVVVASKFQPLLEGFNVIDEEDFVRGLGEWSLVVLPDLSYRKPGLLFKILLWSRFVGYPFDLKLRASWGGGRATGDSIGIFDPWQRRVDLILRHLEIPLNDSRYFIHLPRRTDEITGAVANVDRGKNIVISPFSFPEFRKFSGEFIINIQRRLLSEGLSITMIGEARFRDEAKYLCPENVVNMVGTTSFSEMIALVRNASGFVGLDSGPMHLSLAFGIPTLGLFKAVDPLTRVPSGYSDIFYKFYPCDKFVKTPCYKPGVGYPTSCHCTGNISWTNFSPILEAFIESLKEKLPIRV